MITNVQTSSAWLYTNNNPTSVYVGSQQSAGMLRYNIQNNQMEVYDGNNWLAFGGTATVGLSPEAEEILRWGRTKLQEERELGKIITLESMKQA